jgi:hypothetical protein
VLVAASKRAVASLSAGSITPAFFPVTPIHDLDEWIVVVAEPGEVISQLAGYLHLRQSRTEAVSVLFNEERKIVGRLVGPVLALASLDRLDILSTRNRRGGVPSDLFQI